MKQMLLQDFRIFGTCAEYEKKKPRLKTIISATMAVMRNDYLSWFFFQRSEIPMLTGYSPSRHRTCADLMILKKALLFDIRKQRTIGILDTEFNNLNKSLGYLVTNTALRLNCFATGQFSRPGRAAIDQCISKRCALDHHRSRRLCFAMTSCDLAGCYDRIVHTAAALAMLRIGIPHARIETMFDSIRRMVHRIRTAFKIQKELMVVMIILTGEQHRKVFYRVTFTILLFHPSFLT